MIVIDEAHRLRNVYKHTSKIATAIKQAVAPFPKVLLTATPLQNSLLELYGLVSIIDDFAFGDLQSYRTRFARLGNDNDFTDLKERLAPVQAHASTTGAGVREVHQPSCAGAGVRPVARKNSGSTTSFPTISSADPLCTARKPAALITLILRKLLASSTYAISGTLEGLVHRLERRQRQQRPWTAHRRKCPSDWEDLDELADEWEGEDDGLRRRSPALRMSNSRNFDTKANSFDEFHAWRIRL